MNHAPPDWWRSFFASPGWVATHGLAFSEAQTRAHCDGIISLLGLGGGSHVLDVPCGEGRIAVELAVRGMAVTGIDLSAPLLKQAHDKARERHVHIVWEHGDMRALPWEEAFDAAVCAWSSFGYFDAPEEHARFLAGVWRALKPGGGFYMDITTMETLLPKFLPRQWNQLGDTIVLEESEFDALTGRINSSWTFLRDGESDTHRVSLRLFTVREIAAMLREAGFVEVEALDQKTLEPFRLGSGRAVLVARRPE